MTSNGGDWRKKGFHIKQLSPIGQQGAGLCFVAWALVGIVDDLKVVHGVCGGDSRASADVD